MFVASTWALTNQNRFAIWVNGYLITFKVFLTGFYLFTGSVDQYSTISSDKM